MLIELVPTEAVTPSKVQVGSGDMNDGSPETKAKNPSGIALNRLGIKYHFSPSNMATMPSAQSDAGTDRFTGPVDLATEGRQSPLFRNIYNKIDGVLVYPAELRKEKVQGIVNAKITFSKEGVLLTDQIKIDSSSKFLTVLVARTIRQAFEHPIADAPRYKSTTFAIDCTFNFEITEHNDAELAKSKTGVIVNQFQFYRSFQYSALQWQLGPLSGLGPFAGLDVLWIPRKIAEALSNKAKIDPLQKYRDDPAW